MADEERDWLQIYEDLENSDSVESKAEHYTVLEEAGRGGAKIIFKAVDNSSGREVAYARPLDDGPEKIELFLREARITAYLQHPNILPIYDVSAENLFFVCKLLRGKNLRQVIRRRSKKNDILGWFRKICDAMEYAHSRGVMHLDLKPENIQLDKHGEVLIIDWGLAEIFCTDSKESPLDNPLISSRESVTADFTSLGTPGYMSPEQVLGHKVDARADIFALGALLYFIYKRDSPFAAKTIDETYDKTVGSKISFEGMDLDTGLKSIIQKCLEKRPDKRYASVSELVQDLDAYEQNYVPSAESPSLLRRFILVYKRNMLFWNLVTVFIAVTIVFNAIYIRELNSSREVAITAKEDAEKNLMDLLQTQRENSDLTKALSPHYYKLAQEDWKLFKIKESEEHCRAALQMNPDNIAAKKMYADHLFLKWKVKEAVSAWSVLESTSNVKKFAQQMLKAKDQRRFALENKTKNGKVLDLLQRLWINEFNRSGDLIFLKKVILQKNPKVTDLKMSFDSGYLDLSGNSELRNIQYLAGIKMDSLNLKGTAVEDFWCLKNKRLINLSIGNNEMNDVSSLGYSKIHSLDMSNSKVHSIWPLSNCGIKELNISNTSVGKIPPAVMKGVKTLKSIGNKNLQFPDIESLVEEVEIGGSGLGNGAWNLKKYPHLRRIILNRNQINGKLREDLLKKKVEMVQSSSSLNR